MTDERRVVHLPSRRKLASEQDDMLRAIDLMLAGHFREQNDMLRTTNEDLARQVQRLVRSFDRLFNEVDGVRTGDRNEAFARVAAAGECSDLATVKADFANLYPHTSGKIGEMLGFAANQIGQLLGRRGLNWAADSDYQEMTRWQEGHPRYWHAEVPAKLSKILSTTEPADHGIESAALRTMFRTWKDRQRKASAEAVTHSADTATGNAA